MKIKSKKTVASFKLVLIIILISSFSYFIFESDIVSSAEATGCCEVLENGVNCVDDATSNECASSFAEGSSCEDTPFCKKGCCFDSNAGICGANVLNKDCPGNLEWDGTDSFCTREGCEKGCCFLGTSTSYGTRNECSLDTQIRALGTDAFVDWRRDVGMAECFSRGNLEDEGACILSNGDCFFRTVGKCFDDQGDFFEGKLCTSQDLNTSCVMTDQTKCVEGRDGVYFKDSCGNRANIYDSSKVGDQDYWNDVVKVEDSCGAGDSGGNANSASCGNCNRFDGGICRLALDDGFDVDYGNYYCKDASCEYKGEEYGNGESWCEYDGKVGDGDDVVGSLHRSYHCNFGKVNQLTCADYRNEICAQKVVLDNVTGETFRVGECVINPWRNCINLNFDVDGKINENLVEECDNATGCRIENVDIADNFNFSICTPEHPGGFDLSYDEDGYEDMKNICNIASQKCKVVRKAKLFGGCKYIANRKCLDEGFAEGMNDFCRKLGDCGLEANIVGEYTENYEVFRSPKLGSGWISTLVSLAEPFDDNLVPFENYGSAVDLIDLEDNAGLIFGGSVSGGGSLDIVVYFIPVIQFIAAIFGSKCKPIYAKFECLPWQAPFGGDNCEVCNEDPESCTKYRCQSLGAACGLLDEGTIGQVCYDANPGDSTPPILEFGDRDSAEEVNLVITPTGYNLTNINGGCLDAGLLVNIGVTTSELAQCKYAFERMNYENMSFFESGYRTYEHDILVPLEDPSHGQSQGINWSGDLTVYIKCKDAHGNQGPIDPHFYTIGMCVNQGPDTTPPPIYLILPPSESLVKFGATSSEVSVMTLELSTCRWSLEDKDYSLMDNEMSCKDELGDRSSPYGYVCTDNLTVENENNYYYIRCKDQPWLNESDERNANTISELYVLNRPEEKINIEIIKPDTDFKSPTKFTPIEISVKTAGGGEKHICSYSFSDYVNVIRMGETGSKGIHKQSLNQGLLSGRKTLYIECVDETGDKVQETSTFRITHDTSTPQIARVWQVGNNLNIVTNEFADCRYSTNSCRYNWENGTSMGELRTHTIKVSKGKTYYVKCSDEYGNLPSGCSVQIKAT